MSHHFFSNMPLCYFQISKFKTVSAYDSLVPFELPQKPSQNMKLPAMATE